MASWPLDLKRSLDYPNSMIHSMSILDTTAKVEHVRQVLEAYLQNAGVLMLLQIILLFQVN